MAGSNKLKMPTWTSTCEENVVECFQRPQSRKLFLALALVALVVGCKESQPTELITKENSSLRLFEETTGHLLDIRNKLTISVEKNSLNPLSEVLVLRLENDGRDFLVKIPKSKIRSDGNFEVDESESEQPIKIVGQITNENGQCSWTELITSNKVKVSVEVYKGFSGNKELIGNMKTEIQNLNTGFIKAQL